MIFSLRFCFISAMLISAISCSPTQLNGIPNASKSDIACDNYKKSIPNNLTSLLSPPKSINAHLGEFPHIVALGFYNEANRLYTFYCGGTLISNKFIVTAANCIINPSNAQLKIARMGVVDIPCETHVVDPRIDYHVKNIVVHPNYRRRQFFNNIALVELEKVVVFNNNIRPACLHTQDDPKDFLMTEWGTQGTDDETRIILHKVNVTSVPIPECAIKYLIKHNRTVTDNQICATNPNDTCQRNAGGPLQIPNEKLFTLVGIPSYGEMCGSTFPTVYTKIYSYLDWIESIIWR